MATLLTNSDMRLSGKVLVIQRHVDFGGMKF